MLELTHLEKASLKVMKIVNDIQSTHPYSFGNKDVMLPALEFCYAQIMSGQAGASDTLEPFVIQCILLVQNTLKCTAYKFPKAGGVAGALPTLEQRRGQIAEQCLQYCQYFFHEERVKELCGVLIQR